MDSLLHTVKTDVWLEPTLKTCWCPKWQSLVLGRWCSLQSAPMRKKKSLATSPHFLDQIHQVLHCAKGNETDGPTKTDGNCFLRQGCIVNYCQAAVLHKIFFLISVFPPAKSLAATVPQWDCWHNRIAIASFSSVHIWKCYRCVCSQLSP